MNQDVINIFPRPAVSSSEWLTSLTELKQVEESKLSGSWPLSSLLYKCPLYLFKTEDKGADPHMDPVKAEYDVTSKQNLLELTELVLEDIFNRGSDEDVTNYLSSHPTSIKPVILKHFFSHILSRKGELFNEGKFCDYLSNLVLDAKHVEVGYTVHIDALLFSKDKLFVYIIKNSVMIPILNEYMLGVWIALKKIFPKHDIYLCPVVFSGSEVIIGSYWSILKEDSDKEYTSSELVSRLVHKLTRGFCVDFNDKEKLTGKINKYKSQKCKYCCYDCG